MRPAPYVIDSIERNGLIVYRHNEKSSATIGSVDSAAFYQLKTMMQGVLSRGTARSIGHLAPYVFGKTGTSDNENDAWFVGVTNDVTVAVWLGYDNSDGKRRTLGGGATGGHVAVPIFEPVIQAVWANATPKMALAPPSAEAKRHLACKSIDVDSGEMQGRPGEMQVRVVRPITECLRTDGSGHVVDTQYQFVPRDDAIMARESGGFFGINPNPFGWNGGYYGQRQGTYQGGYQGNQGGSQGYYDNYGRYVQRPPAQVYQQPRVQVAPQRDQYGRPYQQQPRFDPFGWWGGRW
ncbi:MAG: hypothetical protein E6G96_12340 [Alphaproteobacteria bacterium]|nr:MAG: hypothetical protein E6G96_12340 [Alphaproteobacteria bacterium]